MLRCEKKIKRTLHGDFARNFLHYFTVCFKKYLLSTRHGVSVLELSYKAWLVKHQFDTKGEKFYSSQQLTIAQKQY